MNKQTCFRKHQSWSKHRIPGLRRELEWNQARSEITGDRRVADQARAKALRRESAKVLVMVV